MGFLNRSGYGDLVASTLTASLSFPVEQINLNWLRKNINRNAEVQGFSQPIRITSSTLKSNA